jgi:hypothetical protein
MVLMNRVRVLLALFFYYSGVTTFNQAAREAVVKVAELKRFVEENGLPFRLEEKSGKGTGKVVKLLVVEGIELGSLHESWTGRWRSEFARALGVGVTTAGTTAKRLGFEMKPCRRWSAEEVEVLVRSYPEKKLQELLPLFPTRSKTAVKEKIMWLRRKKGLVRKTERWTAERISDFSRMWNSRAPTEEIMEKFGLAKNSVYFCRQEFKLALRHVKRKWSPLPPEPRKTVEALLKTGLTARKVSEETGLDVAQVRAVSCSIGFDNMVFGCIDVVADELNVPDAIKQEAKEHAANLIREVKEQRRIRLVASELSPMALWLACNEAGFPLAMSELSLTAGWRRNELYHKLQRANIASLTQRKRNYARYLPYFTARLPNNYWQSQTHKLQVEEEATRIFTGYEANPEALEKLKTIPLNSIIASVICVANRRVQKTSKKQEAKRIKTVFKTFNCPQSNACKYYVDKISSFF